MTRRMSRNGNSRQGASECTVEASTRPGNAVRNRLLTCHLPRVSGRSYSRVWPRGGQASTFGPGRAVTAIRGAR